MRKILIVLLSLAIVPVSAQQHGIGGSSQYLVGTLRGDGTLVPFAQYSHGLWWNPWPSPRRLAESIYAESTEVVNNSLADLSEPWFTPCLALPTPWFFWSSEGTFTELMASKVVPVRAHSGNNWGLLTDLPKRTSKDPLHDIIGVAITPRRNIEPFIKIETPNTQANEVDSFIKQIFHLREKTEIERTRVERPAAIAKVETSLTILYRSVHAVDGKHIYYFEAEKQYSKRTASDDPGCYDVSLFQGWISADEKGGMGLMDSNFVFTDCDRKGPSTMIPLGTMTLQEQTFLFVREHGWESESYTILELNQSGLHRVLQTDGA
jgi:hypothetical protein